MIKTSNRTVPEVPAPEALLPEVPAPEALLPAVPAPEALLPEVPAPEVFLPEVPAPEVLGARPGQPADSLERGAPVLGSLQVQVGQRRGHQVLLIRRRTAALLTDPGVLGGGVPLPAPCGLTRVRAGSDGVAWRPGG